jgi:hypothetical protein
VRYVRLKGSFRRPGVAGANQFRFTGRLRKKALRPGRYRLVAKRSAGGRTGAALSAAVRIVR